MKLLAARLVLPNIGLLNLVAGQPVQVSDQPRIYVYQLPACSFDSLYDSDDEIPMLALHRRILNSSFRTYDSAQASLFYLPAPFFLWMPSSFDEVARSHAHVPRPYVQYLVLEEARGIFEFDRDLVNNAMHTHLSWTLSFWACLPLIRNLSAQMIIASWADKNHTYKLGVVDDLFALVVCVDGLESATIRLTRAHPHGYWYHFAAVHDHGNLLFYKDGVLLSTYVKTFANEKNQSESCVHQRPHAVCTTPSPFKGSVMDVKVFQVALSRKQVKMVQLSPNTNDSTCLSILRSYIRQSALLERRMGWDHFVLSNERRDCASQEGDALKVERHEWPEFDRFASMLVSGEFTSCGNPHCSYCRNTIVPPTFQAVDSDLAGSELTRKGISSRLLPQLPLDSTILSRTASFQLVADALWKALEAAELATKARGSSEDAEACLLIAGEPAFEFNLFRSIHSRCIPVIVYSSWHWRPQLPFLGSVDWEDFTIFWDVSCSETRIEDSSMTRKLIHWLSQLRASSDDNEDTAGKLLLKEKRRALLQVAPSFEWHGGAMQLLVKDLQRRASHMGSLAKDADKTWRNDDIVEAVLDRADSCNLGSYYIAPTMGYLASNALRRISLISFSDRPHISSFTRPSLARFAAAHPSRYELKFYDAPVVPSQLHPAWNKIELMRNELISDKYDAVVWIDDDIVITDPSQDPIYDAITKSLLPREDKILIASRDLANATRYPLNSGLLVLKSCQQSLALIDELFDIALREQDSVLDGVWLSPALYGFWDQDAFALYVHAHGDSQFVLVEHGILQSFVRPSLLFSFWQPGDFAAHLTSARGKRRSSLTREFILLIRNLTDLWGNSPNWSDVQLYWRRYATEVGWTIRQEN